MRGTLIFFTAMFPYGTGETFIENELPFLSDAFDNIFIVTGTGGDTKPRTIPEKMKVIRVANEVPLRYKLRSLFHFFSPAIQQELGFIKKRLKLGVSKPVLSALLGGYAQALHISDVIEGIVTENNLAAGQVVLYSYWMSNTAAGVALYKSKNPGIQAVCRAHGWDVYFERHDPPYLPLRNFIIQGLDCCCCISQNGKEYLENLLGSDAKKNILVSRLGTFNGTGKRSGHNSDKLALVSCSNIIPLKRIHLIIEALALINDIAIEWTHFGSGKLEDEIKNRAQEKLGKQANIKYHFAGQISNAALLDYYATNKIDLFINLSETEGLPVSFMEVGSFGIPVVATRVGGVGEIIANGINGFLLPPDASPLQIAQTVKGYYNLPPAEKELLRNNAIAEWRKKYNAAVNYADFVEILGKP